MSPFLYFFQKILAHFSLFITEDIMENTADPITQKVTLRTARGRSQLFVEEAKPIYTLLSTRD